MARGDESAPKTPAPCPICGRPATTRWRPFCSARCADVDLGRWLGGRYAIPVREDEEEAGGDVAEERPGDGP
jgi:endogenous inhibitor of DNA gyrase (YacG/DUF329 family)